MFSDPLALSGIAGVTRATAFAGATYHNYVAIGRSDLSSKYRYTVDADTYYDLTISRQVNRRRRYAVRMDEYDTVANPLDTSKNVVKSCSIYVVADLPIGFDFTSYGPMLGVMADFVFDGTDTNASLRRVIGGET